MTSHIRCFDTDIVNSEIGVLSSWLSISAHHCSSLFVRNAFENWNEERQKKSIQFLNFKLKHTKKDKITHTHKIWFFFSHSLSNFFYSFFSNCTFFCYFILFELLLFIVLTSIFTKALYKHNFFFHVYSIVSHFTVIICHFRWDVTVLLPVIWMTANKHLTHNECNKVVVIR